MIQYLITDADYYKARIDAPVRDCATFIDIGVSREDGQRMTLGVSFAPSEAEVHYRELLERIVSVFLPMSPQTLIQVLKTTLKAALGATP